MITKVRFYPTVVRFSFNGEPYELDLTNEDTRQDNGNSFMFMPSTERSLLTSFQVTANPKKQCLTLSYSKKVNSTWCHKSYVFRPDPIKRNLPEWF